MLQEISEEDFFLDDDDVLIVQVLNAYLKPYTTVDEAQAAHQMMSRLAVLCGNEQRFWGLVELAKAKSHSAYTDLRLLAKKALPLFLEEASDKA
jgi:hypothetical protein